MSYYRHHVFFCCNQREAGKPCCNALGASELRDYCKARVKELGLPDVRINSAGCLDRCDKGPVLVIYPEAIWYSYRDRADIDAIVDTHLAQGRIVERLQV